MGVHLLDEHGARELAHRRRYGLLDYLAMASLPNALAGTGSATFNVLRLLGDALGAIAPNDGMRLAGVEQHHRA
ncbi:hypothetical protein ACEN8K_03425, partial [Variovorax sp. CT11-76]